MASAGSVSCIFFFVAIFPSIFADELLWGNVQMRYGNWSAWEDCPHGKYVVAGRIKSQPETKDNTAMNAIQLGCDHLNSLPKESYSNTLKGLEGPAGTWLKWFHCPQGFSGYQFRAELHYEKTGYDDTAANALRLLCGRKWIDLGGEPWAEWFPPQSCAENMVFCGMQTLVEPHLSSGDNTALNSANFNCCTVF